MYQAYKGRFKGGRFVPSELVRIPDNIDVVVMIMGEEIPVIRTKAQRDKEAMDEFLSTIRATNNEPITDKDIADFQQNRVNIRREFNL